jgi:6,7-dimethyl-8-ribityllumazine synthase
MIQKIEGNYEPRDKKFAIVASRWNEFITNHLLDGAIDALKRHGVLEENITGVLCPGAFELPVVCKRLAASKKYDAIIAVGAVIRGSTPHFDFIAAEVTKGLAQISLETGVPCIYGILTTDSIEQAIERSGTKQGNKGFDAAMTALEMVSLFNQI